MLKVLLLAESAEAKSLEQKLHNLEYRVVATIAPNVFDESTILRYKADIVITSTTSLVNTITSQAKKNSETRQQVKAVTHQGVRLVPVNDVYYFQAEHKYVTAFHTQGQLLIEDTLNSLEKEFSNAFVRIHRKTLVSKNKIEMLLKSDSGNFYVKLRGRDESLNVSRRQLSHVRKILAEL